MGAFDGQLALITGATRGFGYAAAVALAKEGAEIIAVGRTSGALEELDDAIQAVGGHATLVPLDITDDGGLQRLCLSIYERWNGVDIWLHSAIHAAPLAPAAHVAEKDMAKSIAINIHASQRLITMVEPLLKAKAGTAVHLDDPLTGQKFFAAYGATKAAQKALFDSWAAETAKIGPRVLSFTPAPMPTATRARFFPGEPRDALSAPEAEANRFVDWLKAKK
jgi:NAD(P)-dependent dehydrogenase (short-subunit alcohol dehydrogenase family)